MDLTVPATDKNYFHFVGMDVPGNGYEVDTSTTGKNGEKCGKQWIYSSSSSDYSSSDVSKAIQNVYGDTGKTLFKNPDQTSMNPLMARQTEHTWIVKTKSAYSGKPLTGTTQTFTVGNKACFRKAVGLKFTQKLVKKVLYLEGAAAPAIPWSDPVTDPTYCAGHYVWPVASITGSAMLTTSTDPVLPGDATITFKKIDSIEAKDEGKVVDIELCPNDHMGKFSDDDAADKGSCQQIKVQYATKACQDPTITPKELDLTDSLTLDTKADYNWRSDAIKEFQFDNWSTDPSECYNFMTW